MLVAVVVAGGSFGVLLTLVRVKVGGPPFEMERRGTLLYLPATGEGEFWASRAREAGPEIMRYDLADWSGHATWNRLLADTATPPMPGYQPKLRPWPGPAAPRQVELAAKGAPVLPARAAAPAPPPQGRWRLVPALRALTPLSGAALPVEWPPLPDGAPPAIPPEGARFLLRLTPDGSVADSLALTKDEGGNAALKTWFRGIRFDPALAAASEWLALALTYQNLITDGADDH